MLTGKSCNLSWARVWFGVAGGWLVLVAGRAAEVAGWVTGKFTFFLIISSLGVDWWRVHVELVRWLLRPVEQVAGSRWAAVWELYVVLAESTSATGAG